MEQIKVVSFDIDRVIEVFKSQFHKYLASNMYNAVITPYKPYEKFSNLMAKGSVITYRLLRREHANLEGRPFAGGTFRKPRLVSETVDTYRVGGESREAIFFDNIVEFLVFSTNSAVRDELSGELENFWLVATSLMRQAGIEKSYLWSRKPDTADNVDGTLVYRATLEFYVMTAKYLLVDVDLIKQINIELSPNN